MALQGRTEEHEEAAAASAKPDGERVWLVHKDGFSGATLLPKEKEKDHKQRVNFLSPWAQPCTIRLDTGEVLTVDDNDVEKVLFFFFFEAERITDWFLL